MGVMREGTGCCWCGVGGRSERVKSGIFSGKGPAMVSISAPNGGGGGGGGGSGTGFLIHRGLLLTTHASVPTASAADAAEIQLHHGRNAARLAPQRFFITSSVLDLTIVGIDMLDADSTPQGLQPHYLKTCCNTILSHGSVVYFLGHTDRKQLVVGEGRVVVATDNLIKFSTDVITWYPGSAGFDIYGNLAFMVCDPMKLSSPTAKSSSASGSSSSTRSWKKDSLMQFGIPIPVICDWLGQHWEGSLDDLSKPRLPLIRLRSIGQRSEYSGASFSQRLVFKSVEEEDNDEISSYSRIVSGSGNQAGSNILEGMNIGRVENSPCLVHEQGIPTPEIYESPRLTADVQSKKEHNPVQLLDINFPPRNRKPVLLPLPLRQLLPEPKENDIDVLRRLTASSKPACHPSKEMVNGGEEISRRVLPATSAANVDCCSEVQSSSPPPMDVSELRGHGDGFGSEGETLYSAETMESRNYPSPKGNKPQHVGMSQSYVDYSGWSSTRKSSATSKGTLMKQRSLTAVRKIDPPSVTPTPQNGHDYYSPTVSSSMKKRNSSEQPTRSRPREVQVSQRWNL